MMKWITGSLRLVMMALLLLVLVYMGGCFDPPGLAPGKGEAPSGGPAPRQTGVVRRTEQPTWFEAVGTVRPRREVTVAPLVPGQLVEMNVEAGGRVEAEAPMARIDAREMSARVGQARSARTAAEAVATQARAHARRVTGLHEQQAATLEELEQAEAGLARAEAELAAAKERVTEAEVAAGYALVTSPMSGVVTERLAEPGDVVWPGKPLYLVHDPADLRLEASVREGLISSIEQGATLEVELTTLGAVVEATIDEIIPAADPSSRSFLVKASLPLVDGLYTGMFGRLRVPLGSREALLAPEAAITRVGQLRMCRVRTEDGWHRRYVTLGETVGPDVVVLSGLAADETLGWD